MIQGLNYIAQSKNKLHSYKKICTECMGDLIFGECVNWTWCVTVQILPNTDLRDNLILGMCSYHWNCAFVCDSPDFCMLTEILIKLCV